MVDLRQHHNTVVSDCAPLQGAAAQNSPTEIQNVRGSQRATVGGTGGEKQSRSGMVAEGAQSEFHSRNPKRKSQLQLIDSLHKAVLAVEAAPNQVVQARHC